MKFKKLTALALSLVSALCIFSFAACGDNTAENPDDDKIPVIPPQQQQPSEGQGGGVHRPGTNINPDYNSGGSSSSQEEHPHQKTDVDKPGVDLPNGLRLRVKLITKQVEDGEGGYKEEYEETDEYYLSDVHECKDETIEIPTEYNGMKVTAIGEYAFEDCTTVKKVIVPSTVVEIGRSAFSYCSKLEEVEIQGENLKTMGYTIFSYSGKFKTVNLPNSLTEMGAFVFSNCPSVETITFPNKEMDIGSGIFLNCSGLTEFTIPTAWKSIPSDMFANCTHLKEVTIPSNIETLDFESFYGCKSFTKIRIPKSVKLIREACFMACTNLIDIYYEGTSDEWMEVEKESMWDYESRQQIRQYKMHFEGDEQ